jgi:hypothetical protein
MYDKSRLRLEISSRGTIPNNSPLDPQNPAVKNLWLKKHQLQSIHAMRSLETNAVKTDSGDTLVAEIGILSNKIGSGKSLCILGLVVSQVRLSTQCFVTYHFGDAAYVMNERRNIQGGNLIVVPNHLLYMWESYIKDYTHLTTCIMKKHMFPFENWDTVAEYDIVLCGASHYNLLTKSCPWTWSRVIFDEADSINIPACVKPSARFVWFVSSSLNNLLFTDGFFLKCEEDGQLTRVLTNGIARNGYIRNTFKRLESVSADCILSKIIVKMNDTYIDEHLNLPPVSHHVVVCEDPVDLVVLDHSISEQVRMILNGSDPQGAMDYLGCPVGSKDNIISFICKNLVIQIKNYEKKIEYLNNIETVDSETQETNRTKLSKTQAKISELDRKLNRIHTKITEFAESGYVAGMCPICLEEKQETCVFTCCLNHFCKDCTDRMITEKTSCPLCRGEFRTIVRTKPFQSNSSATKYTETARVVRERLNDSQASILVFLWSENTIRKLQQVFENKGIPYRCLSGNGNAIRKTIHWFNEKKVRVLLVNAIVYGCGLDLSSATDIVLFQRMHTELENQLTGRAHRIGRTHELNVYRIVHENELTL